MDILFVAGSFDDEGGRESGLMEKLWTHFTRFIDEYHQDDITIAFINGGYFDQLGALLGMNDWEEDPELEFKMKWEGETSFFREPLTKYDVVLWFANIPNDKPKIVEEIKKRHPRHILVTSKRNTEKNYDLREIVVRALKNLGQKKRSASIKKSIACILNGLERRDVNAVDAVVKRLQVNEMKE